MMSIIEAVGITKSFPRTISKEEKGKFTGKFKKTKIRETFKAVDSIDVSLQEGEILGVLGPNGAGKTTLLRILGGIMDRESGELSVCGMNYSDHRHLIKAKIAYISNNTKLYGRFTPEELFYNFGALYGMDKAQITKRIEELSTALKLTEFMDNRIESLSTGQTQRVNIARCLIHSPDIYILDEPTLGLDVISSKDIIEFMEGEKAKGKSVIYSTHYMEEAEYLCDRIVLIYKGRILAEGNVTQLKSQYQVKSVRDLFFKLADIKEDGNEG